VVYFLFVICLCVLAVVGTIVVLHLYLRAVSQPILPVPSWVIIIIIIINKVLIKVTLNKITAGSLHIVCG